MQAVADRLGELAALTGRVFGAARLEALRVSGALAQTTLAQAFVIPVGIRGGSADAVTGLFRQNVSRVVGVVLAYRHAGDPAGAIGVETIEPLVESVIAHVAGWAPDDEIGVFVLQRGELVAMLPGGVLLYQLDFAIDDQLRINSQ